MHQKRDAYINILKHILNLLTYTSNKSPRLKEKLNI